MCLITWLVLLSLTKGVLNLEVCGSEHYLNLIPFLLQASAQVRGARL